MAAGQQPLAPFAVLDATLAVERRLECREAERGALHVRQLRDVLELDALFRAQAMGLATVSQIALSLSCSEFRASRLLVEAQGLAELPGALEAVECGLLTVEQSGTVVAQLAVLDLPGRVAVWRRLQAQLVADHQAGVVRPPARLAERLRRWVVEQDRQAAEERRRRAEEHRRLDYRKRDDGLADLFAFGFRPLELQAILQRIQALSAPLGADDDRTADQRRFDALRDLLLGRHDRCPAAADGAAGGAACGCRPGELAPCGAQLQVLVTLRGALGISDEVGELVGHGPIEPDQLQALLANRPQLRAVFTDDAGVPVATSDMVLRPERGDAASVRQALLQLSRMSPDDWHPRHPDDHPPEDLLGQPPGDDPPEDFDGHPFDDDSRGAALPGRRAADRSRRGGSLRRPELACPVPAGLSGPHPAGDPGPYQVRGRLRRLVFTRAPRCEFPGCGAAAVRCDAEHDRAHPDGPSCACNVGPLCRRHHRVKQLGWIKTRTIDSAVRWTNPTGRSWTSPSQHAPPAPAVRPLPLLPINDNPWDQLSPSALDQELAHLGLLPPDDDPQRFELRAIDLDPDDVDPYPLDPWGQPRDTTWTLDLADPYGWMDPRGVRAPGPSATCGSATYSLPPQRQFVGSPFLMQMRRTPAVAPRTIRIFHAVACTATAAIRTTME